MPAAALPEAWRLHAYNGSGATVTVTAKIRQFRYNQGDVEYDAAASTIMSSVSVADGAGEESSTQNNNASNENWIGFHGVVTIVGGAASDGPVDIYVQPSPDDGTDWPDDQQGFLVGSAVVGNSQTVKIPIAF